MHNAPWTRRRTAVMAVGFLASLVSLLLTSGAVEGSTPTNLASHVTTSAQVRAATRTIVNDCYYVVSRPAHIDWCGNTSDRFRRLSWSKWAAREARARGILLYDDCNPSCADGSYHRAKATVRLHDVVFVHHMPRYSRLTWRFVNRKNHPHQVILLYVAPLGHSWYGNARSNTFDLDSGRPGYQSRDRVLARGGRDWIFMRADHLSDVIRCGPGSDKVMYLVKRERRDRYVGCEHVIPYSP
jgi:hypothetical protein